MKDKKAAAGAGIGLAVIGVALAVGLGAKKAAEAAPEKEPIVGEDAKYIPVIRHPEIPPEEAYDELKILPTPQEEILLSLATKQPIVSPLIDLDETSENREYIEAIEDAEGARLMALPNGGQCTATFVDGKGDYYACCNGYAILTNRAKSTPEQLAAMTEAVVGKTREEAAQAAGEAYVKAGGEIEKAGVYAGQPKDLTWMEKEKLEETRTGYSKPARLQMMSDYRTAHPGVSGAEANKILFG
ncbi:hypothetical protein ES707_13554 [subsurface metagenome]